MKHLQHQPSDTNRPKEAILHANSESALWTIEKGKQGAVDTNDCDGEQKMNVNGLRSFSLLLLLSGAVRYGWTFS